MGTISLQIPVIGQPDTTEDVKLQNSLTTIQNVINGGLDPTNLSPTTGILHLAYRNGSANLTANAGDWIVAVPGVTVTIPAPTLNAVVAVTTNSAVSGSSPVTISGTNIYGPGLSAASSFLLGSPVASVVLHSDASNWIIRVGQQDTGWVALTLPANVSASGGSFYAPTARLVGDRVFLRGQVTAGVGASGTTIATVPAGLRPSGVPAINATFWNGSSWIAGSLNVQTSGAILMTASLVNGFQFNFDSISYSIS